MGLICLIYVYLYRDLLVWSDSAKGGKQFSLRCCKQRWPSGFFNIKSRYDTWSVFDTYDTWSVFSLFKHNCEKEQTKSVPRNEHSFLIQFFVSSPRFDKDNIIFDFDYWHDKLEQAKPPRCENTADMIKNIEMFSMKILDEEKTKVGWTTRKISDVKNRIKRFFPKGTDKKLNAVTYSISEVKYFDNIKSWFDLFCNRKKAPLEL